MLSSPNCQSEMEHEDESELREFRGEYDDEYDPYEDVP